jgi:hypothetical protein
MNYTEHESRLLYLEGLNGLGEPFLLMREICSEESDDIFMEQDWGA